MQVRRAPRGWVVAASALSGAVVGHSLTYVLAVRNADLRDALLKATGHGYWPAAVSGAIVLGSVALATIARSHLRASPIPERSSVGVTAWFLTLAPLQLGIFLVQEALERISEHIPLSGLVHQHLIQFGVPAQLLIALVFALILRGTAEMAEAAGRALRSPSPKPRSAISHPEPSTPLPSSRLVPHSGESRAPPLQVT